MSRKYFKWWERTRLILFRLFREKYKERLFANWTNTAELNLLSEIIKDCKLSFIDIGANAGLYVHAARKIIPPSQIIAIEPQPYYAKKLMALFPGVQVKNIGLSDKPHTTEIFVPFTNGEPDPSLASLQPLPDGIEYLSYPVECNTLDHLMLAENQEKKWFVKMDVEGHEFKVLLGGKDTILHRTSVLLIELESRHHENRNLPEMIKEIEMLGLKSYFLEPRHEILVPYNSNSEYFDGGINKIANAIVNNFWFFAENYNWEQNIFNWNAWLQTEKKRRDGK